MELINIARQTYNMHISKEPADTFDNLKLDAKAQFITITEKLLQHKIIETNDDTQTITLKGYGT